MPPNTDELQLKFLLVIVINDFGNVISVKIKDKKAFDYTLCEKGLISVIKNMPKWQADICSKKRIIYSQIEFPLNLEIED